MELFDDTLVSRSNLDMLATISHCREHLEPNSHRPQLYQTGTDIEASIPRYEPLPPRTIG